MYILRPATLSKSAQSFDHNGQKYASGIHFMNQNGFMFGEHMLSYVNIKKTYV